MVAVGCVVLLAFKFFHPGAAEAKSLHASIETIVTLLAFMAAWLLRWQFAYSRALRDLLLLAALLTLGLEHLAWGALPAALDLHDGAGLAAAGHWSDVAVAGLTLAAALSSAERVLGRPRHPVRSALFCTVALIALSPLAALPLRVELAGGLSASYRADAVVHHPLTFTLLLTAGILFAAAAVVFVRSERATRDEPGFLLAGGALLMATAQVSYIMNPVASSRLGPREGLALAGSALFLAFTVIRELRSRRLLARAAAMAERMRLARELHDGLVQDLAFLAAYGDRVAAETGEEHPVAVAARRALAISRSTIVELSDCASMTVHETLAAVAHELGDRFGVAIAVEADPNADLPWNVHYDVSQIAREAIANAARHGGARNIIVSLTRDRDGLTLRVLDDGCGIDRPSRPRSCDGFGLRSMRERAAAAGGYLSIRQRGRQGTEVEVVLP